MKQHLAGIRGQVLPYEAPNEVIGGIRVDLLNQFRKFEEDKARQKEIEAKIGRKRELVNATMRRSGLNEFEGSSSAPSFVVRTPSSVLFHLVQKLVIFSVKRRRPFNTIFQHLPLPLQVPMHLNLKFNRPKFNPP